MKSLQQLALEATEQSRSFNPFERYVEATYDAGPDVVEGVFRKSGMDPGYIDNMRAQFDANELARAARSVQPSTASVIRQETRTDRSRSYYAMAAVGAGLAGLGLAKWQMTPKDDRSKATQIASREATAKAESIESPP